MSVAGAGPCVDPVAVTSQPAVRAVTRNMHSSDSGARFKVMNGT